MGNSVDKCIKKLRVFDYHLNDYHLKITNLHFSFKNKKKELKSISALCEIF